MARIEVDPVACAGCSTCELVCAFKHFKVVNPWKSAIRVLHKFPEKMEYEPIVCRQCEEPKCVEACPTEALRKENGIVKLDVEKCVGCFACKDACPYSAIFKHPEVNHPIKCDLCGGDPECIKWCPKNAIKLVG